MDVAIAAQHAARRRIRKAAARPRRRPKKK
jgi:hypothetical protein